MITFPTSLTLSHTATQPREHHSQAFTPAEKMSACSREISRMLTAAVVSRKFCQLLLTDPVLAIQNGYNGETFQVSADEIDLLRSVVATTLPDFAAQLLMASTIRENQVKPGAEERVRQPRGQSVTALSS